jgi:hypothetical protein
MKISWQHGMQYETNDIGRGNPNVEPNDQQWQAAFVVKCGMLPTTSNTKTLSLQARNGSFPAKAFQLTYFKPQLLLNRHTRIAIDVLQTTKLPIDMNFIGAITRDRNGRPTDEK